MLCKELAKNNIRIFSYPFIQQKIIGHHLPSAAFDWVFFSSPFIARQFLRLYPDVCSSLKIATLGKGTSKEVEEFGCSVEFEGFSTDIEQVAKAFRDTLKSGRCLIPIGNKSVKSIQKNLNSEQYVEVIFYKTENFIREIPKVDGAFITSPSNAEGFVSSLKNECLKVFSMGTRTKQYLDKQSVKNTVSLGFDEGSLCRVILSEIQS